MPSLESVTAVQVHGHDHFGLRKVTFSLKVEQGIL